MNYLPVDKGLLIHDINWKCKTAGPSPHNNERIEVFLLGCKKAAKGNPCRGCFNSPTWDTSKAIHSLDPKEVAHAIAEHSSNRYITIGGGEPTDQLNALILFAHELKQLGFHITMYSWKKFIYDRNSVWKWKCLDDSKNDIWYNLLFDYIDIIIDSPFDINQRLYKEDYYDGLYGSVGSGNQRIWDTKKKIYARMDELYGIYLNNKNELVFDYK